MTVFNKTQVTAEQAQVLAHILLDDKGAEICRASIQDVQTIQVDQDFSRAVIPQRVRLVWQPQQIEMTMRLCDAQVNSIDAPHAARVFSRADLASIPAANLAQGMPDAPYGVSQMSIQRTRLHDAGAEVSAFAASKPAQSASEGFERNPSLAPRAGLFGNDLLLRRLGRQVAAVGRRRRGLDAFCGAAPGPSTGWGRCC